MCEKLNCNTYINYDPPKNFHSQVNGLPGIETVGGYTLLNMYMELRKNRLRPISNKCLHVMLSADSVWGESGQLELRQDEPWGNIPEQRAIQLAVFHKHRDCSQIVISQDINFLQSLRELCKTGVKGAPNSEGLVTLSINEQGFLYDPFEAAEDEDSLLARISRKKLSALVQLQPTYIDDSALRHPQANEMLQNIKPGLMQAEKQLIVLASKKEPLALSDTLVTRAQETPPSVRFAWLREGLGKTEALIEALLSETASLPSGSKISLITDRVTRAEKIQQRLIGSGILVEIYSVNKHGFLSNRDKTQPALFASAPPSLTTAKNKQLIEEAVKGGDVQTALSLASDKEALKNGVITCLCEKQADTLEQLLKQADRVQSTIINWWILEYKQFLSPSFLMENPRFYDLLVLALSKCHFFAPQAEKWVDKLQDLEESPTAAKVELSFLISLLKQTIDRPYATATRIRRTDIPKVLPRTERSEVDLLRGKLHELTQKKDLLVREIEKLTAERFEMERQIAKLEAELSIKCPN